MFKYDLHYLCIYNVLLYLNSLLNALLYTITVSDNIIANSV